MIEAVEAISHPEPSKRLFLTANEVATKEFSDDRFLWGVHFIRSATNGIVGGSDTGKSTLLRLLAIAIAKGDKEFLGQPLRTRNKKVLIMSFEDGERDVNSFFKEFRADLIGSEALENIHFVFEYQGKAIDTLQTILEDQEYDAILIDSYSDVYDGFSGNDQMETKRFMNQFDSIAKRHNTAVVFLHHTNKAKEGVANKNATMGSAAFEQMVRSLVTITKKKGYHSNLRHIQVTKGNYVRSKDKLKEIIIRFDEDKLDFEFKGISGVKEKETEAEKSIKQEIIAFCKGLRQKNTSWRNIEKAVKGKFGESYAHTTLQSWVEKAEG